MRKIIFWQLHHLEKIFFESEWESNFWRKLLTVIIDREWLISGEDFILANVPILGRTVSVRCLHSNDLVVESSFINLFHVGWLKECWRVLVDVNDSDVNSGTAITATEKTSNIINYFVNNKTQTPSHITRTQTRGGASKHVIFLSSFFLFFSRILNR